MVHNDVLFQVNILTTNYDYRAQVRRQETQVTPWRLFWEIIPDISLFDFHTLLGSKITVNRLFHFSKYILLHLHFNSKTT